MKGFRLQVLGYSLILFYLFTVTCTLYPTYAADSSSSASTQSKLEILKQEIASRAAKLAKEVSKKLQNRAFVGKIVTKSPNSLTISTRDGTKMVSTNEDTVFQTPIKKIQVDDRIAALGDIDDTGVLNARKVIVIPEEENVKTYLWGVVISKSDKILTLKDKEGKNIAVSAKTTILPEKFKLNSIVIITAKLSKNDILEANFIHLLDQVASPSAKESTPSANYKQ